MAGYRLLWKWALIWWRKKSGRMGTKLDLMTISGTWFISQGNSKRYIHPFPFSLLFRFPSYPMCHLFLWKSQSWPSSDCVIIIIMIRKDGINVHDTHHLIFFPPPLSSYFPFLLFLRRALWEKEWVVFFNPILPFILWFSFPLSLSLSFCVHSSASCFLCRKCRKVTILSSFFSSFPRLFMLFIYHQITKTTGFCHVSKCLLSSPFFLSFLPTVHCFFLSLSLSPLIFVTCYLLKA